IQLHLYILQFRHSFVLCTVYLHFIVYIAFVYEVVCSYKQYSTILRVCSATASVSYPSSLRNSFPNGSQGHPWFTPAAESHPVPSRVKQCSTRLQIYSTIGID
ncbi:MAG: hypothetical protein ACK56F_28185, partial [bacterium]